MGNLIDKIRTGIKVIGITGILLCLSAVPMKDSNRDLKVNIVKLGYGLLIASSLSYAVSENYKS